MKVISSSVYGTDPMYSNGAIKNAELLRELFPDWRYIMYVEDTPELESTRSILDDLGCMVIPSPTPEGNFGMYWRFLPISMRRVTHVVIRDVDSRLSRREVGPLEEWASSTFKAHIIRDHEDHVGYNLMGANWGIRGGIVKDIHKMILEWGHWEKKGSDIFFLKKYIWPLVRDSCMHHGFRGREMAKREPGEPFVGQIFDELDKPISGGAENDENMRERSRLYGKSEWPERGDKLWQHWQSRGE